jgi:hypothetical protein
LIVMMAKPDMAQVRMEARRIRVTAMNQQNATAKDGALPKDPQGKNDDWAMKLYKRRVC